MKIIVLKDFESVSQAAAKMIIDQVKENPASTLGLATGSSPIRLYEIMREDHKENGTSYKDVKSFNLDEYYGLSHDHPQSYYYFMNHHLFSGIDIDLNNVHVPSGTLGKEEAADEYNKMLAENHVDLQLLGIGSNGHIGFNEPGTPFDSLTHCVALKESTIQDNARLFFDGKVEDVPTHAITMGIGNIMQAGKVLLIACGKNKAKAVKGMIEDEPSIDLPASALQNHPDFTVIIDEDAASLLTNK